MNIILATKDDLPELDKFVRYPGVLVGEGLENFDYLSVAFRRGHFIYKCIKDDECVGLMCLNMMTRHIEVFSIDEGHRNKGLWKPMLEYLISNHGAAKLYGETADINAVSSRVLRKYDFTNVPVANSNRQGWWL